MNLLSLVKSREPTPKVNSPSMSYSIVVNDTFLNQLLGLPLTVSKKVSPKLRAIQKDPISAGGDAKKLHDSKGTNLYRVRLGDYRLVYSFNHNWVKCLSIGHRSDIYKYLNIDDPEIELKGDPNDIKDEIPSFPKPQPGLLTEEMLKNCFIPPEYIQPLLSAKTEEDLLYLDIPGKILTRVLDILYPPSLATIEKQAEKLLPKIDDLDLFFQGNISEFLLKLDEEQERICNYKLGNPVLMKGGPGTGKTVIAIYRVQKLLEQGCKSILFTAHSSALIAYADKLLEQLLGDLPLKLGVEINTVDALIDGYFKARFPTKRIPDSQSFLNYIEKAIAEVKDNPKQGISNFNWSVSKSRLIRKGLNYLYREIVETIESCGLITVDDYLNFSSAKKLERIDKLFIWAVYEKVKLFIQNEGFMTEDEPKFAALKQAERDANIHKYDAIVIDEAQDLSPVAFKFLLSRVSDRRNVFVTADSSQAIYKRGFNWKQVHKYVSGYILTLNFNYRNTEEISAACRTILHAEDNYQPSKRNSEIPRVIFCKDEMSEIQAIKDFFIESARHYKIPLMGAALICPNVKIANDYTQRLNNIGLKASYVEGINININLPCVKVITMEASKGLEFPFVAVAGLHEGVFPYISPELKEDEQLLEIAQQKRLFYVACSRAIQNLAVFSILDKSSSFLDNLNQPYWHREGE